MSKQEEGERNPQTLSQHVQYFLFFYRLMHTETILFLQSYAFIDIAILFSQRLQLEWETYIFEIMLTIFNFHLIRTMSVHCQEHYMVIAYFSSGLFVLTNLAIDWVLGTHLHLLTLTANFGLMLLCMEKTSKLKIFLILMNYLVQFFIFACIDDILALDIRWALSVPLAIEAVLFGKSLYYLIQSTFFKNESGKMRNIFKFFMDLSVMTVTSLPFIYYFLPHLLQQAAFYFLIFHLLFICLFLYNYPYNHELFLLDIWSLFNRKAQHFFVQYPGPVSSARKLIPWQQELCSKCSQWQANVLFSCGHLLLCKGCYLDMKIRQLKVCYLCGFEVEWIYDLRESLGEQSMKGVYGLDRPEAILFNLYPKINKSKVGQEQRNFFLASELDYSIEYSDN